MRDGPLRRALKRVALWGFRANLAVHRTRLRSRGERPWTLGGGCRRSGGCCEAPAIAVGRTLWSTPGARRLFLGWQRRVNGFGFVSADERAHVLVFRCSHFDRATRSCDSYDSRPGMCRDYPRNLMWQPNPELLPACGYRAIPSNAAGLRAALDAAELSPHQRERLRKGLRLEG
jgi:Fe-S-cluster containining protein